MIDVAARHGSLRDVPEGYGLWEVERCDIRVGKVET